MHHDANVIAEESSLAPDQSKSGIEIELYTDGACRGNPGPGGWAYILRHLPTGKEVECNGGERDTTNNRMELQAVLHRLLCLHPRIILPATRWPPRPYPVSEDME